MLVKTSAHLRHCWLQVLDDGKVRLSRKAALLDQLGISYSDDVASKLEAPAKSEEEIEVGKVYRCAFSLSPVQKPFASMHSNQYWLAGLAQMSSTLEVMQWLRGDVRAKVDVKGVSSM